MTYLIFKSHFMKERALRNIKACVIVDRIYEQTHISNNSGFNKSWFPLAMIKSLMTAPCLKQQIRQQEGTLESLAKISISI